jgi:2'-5' RNA ligase
MTAARPIPAAPFAAQRLFIALWPPEGLARALHERYRRGRGDSPARPVAVHDIHLTLHFLGQVPASVVDELRHAIRIFCPAFELRIERIEAWRGGLVVALPARIPQALTSRHDALAEALHRLGLRTEARPFRPHLTLARKHAGPWPATGASVASALLPKPLTWRAHDHVLVRSRIGPDGGYDLLQTYG